MALLETQKPSPPEGAQGAAATKSTEQQTRGGLLESRTKLYLPRRCLEPHQIS